MSTVNYCQWLLGTVTNNVANGQLGECYAYLNSSTVQNYQVCVSAVQTTGSLQQAAANVDTLLVIVILLAVVAGVLLIACIMLAICFGSPWFLLRRQRSRQVVDGVMLHQRRDHPQQMSSSAEERSSGMRYRRLTPEQSVDAEAVLISGATSRSMTLADSGSPVRRSSVAWVPYQGSQSYGANHSLLQSRIGIQEEMAKGIVRMVEQKKYQRGRLLGRGGSGSVHCCLLGNGSFVAHKELHLPALGKAEAAQILHELAVISRLNHRHCVRYYHAEVNVERHHVAFWMEFVPGGALSSLVKSLDGPLAENVAKSYIRQVLHGLAYLHSHGIVHRDVKADNVLVDSDGIVKLADFGSSKVVRRHRNGSTNNSIEARASYTDTMVGTPYWMAPEVVTLNEASDNGKGEEGYNHRADVWSLGILACEILSQGQVPWPSFNTYWEILMHVSQQAPTLPQHVSPLCREFLSACLVRDPKKRPPARELLLHRWFDDDVMAPATSFDVEANSDFKTTFGFRECLRTLGELSALEAIEDNGAISQRLVDTQQAAAASSPPAPSLPARPNRDVLPNTASVDTSATPERTTPQFNIPPPPRNVPHVRQSADDDDDLLGDPFPVTAAVQGSVSPYDEEAAFNINISSTVLDGSQSELLM